MRCGIGLTDTRKEGPPAPSTRSTARPAKIPRLVHVCRGCHVDLRAPRSSSCRAIPETATLRLARTSSVCQALRYVAEIRLTAEGFANVALVGDAAAPTIAWSPATPRWDALSRAIPRALGRGCAPIDSRRQAVMLIGSSRSRTSRSARSRMSPPLACGFGWSVGGKAETAGGAFENARRRAGTAGRI